LLFFHCGLTALNSTSLCPSLHNSKASLFTMNNGMTPQFPLLHSSLKVLPNLEAFQDLYMKDCDPVIV